jgi:arylsulfatase A-like enzyme/Flp pilus assembly protein TadD
VRRPAKSTAAETAGVALVFVLGLALFVPSACRRSPVGAPAAAAARRRPDVLLITIDTLRADAPGFAGNRRARTPNLDRLASEGVAFTNVHAHAVVTLPSHASILTGLYPHQHGIRDNDGFRLPPGVPTLATLLSARGYQTAAFIAAFPLDARFGLSRGFAVYDESYPMERGGGDFAVPERAAPEVIAAARAWYRKSDGRPRLLWVHLYDCHFPHVAPPELAREFADDPYPGEVTGVDAALRPLLEDVRASGIPTLVVATSDHGEALGEHGEQTHGLFAYEATLKVPLVLWGFPQIPPEAASAPAGHVDILPTILEAAGVRRPDGLPGRSLLARPDPRRILPFEALTASLTRGWAPLRGAIGRGWKYVDLPLPELYELGSDPGEMRNRVAERPDVLRELASAVPRERAVAQGASADDAARLRSLGYLSGSASQRASYGPEDDPKRLVSLDTMLQRMIGLYQSRRLSESISVGREILAARPTMPVTYEFLSFVQAEAGRTEDAIATLELARRRRLLSDSLASRLALLYSERGRPREALGILEPLAASTNPDVLNALGIARASAGKLPEALEAFEAALRADPANAAAHQNAGLTWIRRGDAARALKEFDLAFAINGSLPRAWNGRGVALEQLGRHAEALSAWKRAVELDPRQFDALWNVGSVAARVGDAGLSRRALERFIATAPPALYAGDIARARRMLAGRDSGMDNR